MPTMDELAGIRMEAAAMAGLANNKAMPVEERLACADRSSELFIQALELLDEKVARLRAVGDAMAAFGECDNREPRDRCQRCKARDEWRRVVGDA